MSMSVVAADSDAVVVAVDDERSMRRNTFLMIRRRLHSFHVCFDLNRKAGMTETTKKTRSHSTPCALGCCDTGTAVAQTSVCI